MVRRRRPSMTDVARRAGVSQTTVSLVLNDPENSKIPPATQQRVLQAVREVGYRTNRLARAMRLDRTDTIGFVTDNIAITPHANAMIQGAQDAAWNAGLLLLVVNTGPVYHPAHHKLERAAIDELLERQVDGIIIAAMFHRVIDPHPALLEGRAVLLDARTADGTVASVVPDEFEAAYRATSHLIEHGHRRIAHVTIPQVVPASELRRDGYRAALTDHGIEPDPELYIDGVESEPGGAPGIHQLLNLAELPTAVFCFNDELAMTLYQAAHDRGLRIPDDISVIGFDDQALVASRLWPPLTTMRLPHYEMGQWAVRTLLGRSQPGKGPQYTIHCPLVERHSVADI